MVFQGHVENGVIRLDHPTVLPEGAKVRVQLISSDVGSRSDDSFEQELSAIWADVPQSEWNRLPADLTDNLDHYIYGTSE